MQDHHCDQAERDNSSERFAKSFANCSDVEHIRAKLHLSFGELHFLQKWASTMSKLPSLFQQVKKKLYLQWKMPFQKRRYQSFHQWGCCEKSQSNLFVNRSAMSSHEMLSCFGAYRWQAV
jgi:hypothetical protein